VVGVERLDRHRQAGHPHRRWLTRDRADGRHAHFSGAYFVYTRSRLKIAAFDPSHLLSLDRMQPASLHFRRFFAPIALVLSLAACAGHQGDDQLATSMTALDDGTRIAFVHQGLPSQQPAVVFQSGLGDGHAAWVPVLQQLPADTQAVAADRPGYGASPLRDGTRDACRIAQEQRALLHEAGAKPPYVLVGHSIGGLYQYVYARLYPDEVAGLVLLDPTHPAMLPTLEREQPGAAALLQLARHTVFSPAMAQEFDDQAGCLAHLATGTPLTMPTVVLTSTRPAAYAVGDMQATLDRLQQDWMAPTGVQALTPVPGSGHRIHHDAPQAVVRAIRAITQAGAAAL
jgi:pimeloyl-ACP methyl ester carboxylesterase